MSYLPFLKQQISWFENDLSSCLQVAKEKINDDSSFPGGLNFTAGLVLFAVIDFVTSCYSGKVWPDAIDAAEFMKRYVSKYEKMFENEDFSIKFYQVFRHGLAHQWSPKGGGVAMDFNYQRFFGLLPDGTPVLNVPILFEITKQGIQDYLKDLESDQRLLEKLGSRYVEIARNDSKEASELNEICTKIK